MSTYKQRKIVSYTIISYYKKKLKPLKHKKVDDIQIKIKNDQKIYYTQAKNYETCYNYLKCMKDLKIKIGLVKKQKVSYTNITDILRILGKTYDTDIIVQFYVDYGDFPGKKFTYSLLNDNKIDWKTIANESSHDNPIIGANIFILVKNT